MNLHEEYARNPLAFVRDLLAQGEVPALSMRRDFKEFYEPPSIESLTTAMAQPSPEARQKRLRQLIRLAQSRLVLVPQRWHYFILDEEVDEEVMAQAIALVNQARGPSSDMADQNSFESKDWYHARVGNPRPILLMRAWDTASVQWDLGVYGPPGSAEASDWRQLCAMLDAAPRRASMQVPPHLKYLVAPETRRRRREVSVVRFARGRGWRTKPNWQTRLYNFFKS